MKTKAENKTAVTNSSERRLQFRLHASAEKLTEKVVDQLTRSSYQIGQDLFGRVGSGQGARSVNRKQAIKQAIRRKRVR